MNYAAAITALDNVLADGLEYINKQLEEVEPGTVMHNTLLLQKTKLWNEHRAAVAELMAQRNAEEEIDIGDLKRKLDLMETLGVLAEFLEQNDFAGLFPGLVPG